MLKTQLKKIAKSQTGYASFVIALVTIIVVSLIVIAFAADSRLEQKNSLANNLADQAYYAAESGINDAYSIIAADTANGVSPLPSTSGTCATNGAGYITTVGTSTSNQIDSNGNIQYSCLIVNPSPPSVEQDGVAAGQGVVVPIKTTSSIAKITISWQYDQSTVNGNPLNFSGCPPSGVAYANLPKIANYPTATCSAGVLQLDGISGSSLGGELRSANPFNSQATTVFLEPTNGAPSSPGFINDGVSYITCNSTVSQANPKGYLCSISLSVPSDTTYYLHLIDFYVPSNITITAQDSTNNTLNISGAQVLIDSTGTASGQIKRLQARVCDSKFCGSNAAVGAIQSSTCVNKQFQVYPGDSNPRDLNPNAPGNTPAGC